MMRIDHLLRVASQRMTRRQAGAFGAGVLALLAGVEPAETKKRKRSAKRGRPQQHQDARRRRRCGGIAGLPCPKGFTCVDDPRDDCDPEAGGADCFGICVRKVKDPCATIRCREGTRCCPRCGRVCLPIPEDIPCSRDVCEGKPCNETTCGPGEYCCNRSCSLCVPLGQGCTRQICPPKPPEGEPCGRNRCGPGEYCCNPSCGVCAPLNGGCAAVVCDPEPGDEPCGRAVCPRGKVCCNASCGICTDPGMACIMIACAEIAAE